MNITPRSIFKGKNSDGTTFRAEEWDFNTLAQIEVTGMLVMIGVTLVLSSFLSLFLMIMCIINYSGGGTFINIIGIIIGTYFLIDCSQGWLTLMALWLFFDERTINLIVGLNVGALVVHLTLVMFGTRLDKSVNGNLGSIIVILGIIFGVGMCIGVGMHSDKGWVQNKIKPVVAEVVDHRSFEQIDKDADDSYREARIREGKSPENEFARNRGER